MILIQKLIDKNFDIDLIIKMKNSISWKSNDIDEIDVNIVGKCNIFVDKYTDKSIVVYGSDINNHIKKLVSLGGRKNAYLTDKGYDFKGGLGYIFPINKRNLVEEWIEKGCIDDIEISQNIKETTKKVTAKLPEKQIIKSLKKSPKKAITQKVIKKLDEKVVSGRIIGKNVISTKTPGVKSVEEQDITSNLPKVLKEKIALELSNEELIHLCQTNKDWKRICDENNDSFWKLKVKEFDEYFFPDLPYGLKNWKELFITLYGCYYPMKKFGVGAKIHILSRNLIIDRNGQAIILNISKNRKSFEFIYIDQVIDADPVLNINKYGRNTMFAHKTPSMKIERWFVKEDYDDLKKYLNERGKRMNLNSLKYEGYDMNNIPLYPIFLFDNCSNIVIKINSKINIYVPVYHGYNDGSDFSEENHVSFDVVKIEYNQNIHNIKSTIITLKNGKIIIGFIDTNMKYYYINDQSVLDTKESMQEFINKYSQRRIIRTSSSEYIYYPLKIVFQPERYY